MTESPVTVRRAFLRLGITVPAAAAALLVFGPARAQMKISKSVADYQHSPHDGQQCANCRFFQPPGGCRLVKGRIEANGWCSRWAPGTS